jgi:hypothetical protein
MDHSGPLVNVSPVILKPVTNAASMTLPRHSMALGRHTVILPGYPFFVGLEDVRHEYLRAGARQPGQARNLSR